MKKQKILSLALALIMLMSLAACAKPAAQTAEEPAAEAAKKLTVKVTWEGEEEILQITTNEETLGAALLAEGLISGSDSEWGLFVDTVNGHFADANKGKYWVFTKSGEMVMTGVDSTPIEDGDSFEWYIYE